MKKISQLLIVGILALTIVFSLAEPVKALSQTELVDLVEEEMTAEYLYAELYKKYPENQLFSNLAESENRHSNALTRVISRLGMSTEDAKIQDIEIPETKEEALEFAMTFEKEDIEMLENLLESVENNRLERVLRNLLKGSTQHYETLQKALEEGIDNLTCNEGRSEQNKNRNR
ncbi:MAG: DUF2202 domain-containing protein [Saccharofermentanales bacterium]